MSIRLSITLAISLILLGASYAFADGMLNDNTKTRELGGVGNYLFWSTRDAPKKTTETAVREKEFEQEPTAPSGVQEIKVRQSSATKPVENITFPSNSSKLTQAEKARLDGIASTLKSDPETKVLITGYTDDVGPNSRNKDLSNARARAVVQSLRKSGVSDNQLSWSAKGEENPVSSNSTAEGRAQNRRVEIQFE